MDNHQNHIRNFCIISHIDHGKSTLADRFLELTGTVAKHKMREQYLDQMDLERERGITIKMQPVRMAYRLHRTDTERDTEQTREFRTVPCGTREAGVQYGSVLNSEFILNLIDTPGHVDFSYEVSRALAAVEGAILLVDATRGVQAQTITNLHFAQDQNLVIIPVVNKIDLQNARIEETKKEIAELLKIDPEEILAISAKNGIGIDGLLQRVVEKIPSPTRKLTADSREQKTVSRALVFDSKFDPFKGVIAYVRVFEGEIRSGEKVKLVNQNISAEVLELGILKPEFSQTDVLGAGEIGYIATGIKEAEKMRVGETIGKCQVSGTSCQVKALPGYKESKPMVFASFYPEDADDYVNLRDAFKKLKLQDASLFFEDEYSSALGRGFRCGFLGILHMEIISERLKREFGLDLVITSPTVRYKIKEIENEKETIIYTPSDLPREHNYKIFEPWAKLEIIAPPDYLGKVMDLLNDVRGEFGETNYLGAEKIIVIHHAPLQEIIAGFFDKLKSVSSGYASMNYIFEDWREADLDELEILVAGEKIENLNQVVFAPDAYKVGKSLLEKLKEFLPRQSFAVSLQARFRGKIIARKDLKALRKDVIAGLYGGDYTRKRKLLEKQKKGKKKMRALGRIKIPAEVFLKILRR